VADVFYNIGINHARIAIGKGRKAEHAMENSTGGTRIAGP
jgi:hypothetical protein